MKNFPINIILPALLIALMAMTGCRRGPVDARLDLADSLMESRPDSALTILDSISAANLRGDALKARHALLLSMALDKNYVDTTTFDVLQPAIDYYPRYGSPDEKLRTYYYQGRIYQNRGESDAAMSCFMDGKEYFPEATDTLTMANLLTANGSIMLSRYDVDGYIRENLEAASCYKSIGRTDYEMDCLAYVLNGAIIKENKALADSIIAETKKYAETHPELSSVLEPYYLGYITELGNEEEIRALLSEYESGKYSISLDDNELIDIAWAYYKLGDIKSAIECIKSINDDQTIKTSLKYLSIQPNILVAAEDYKGALAMYRRFAAQTDSIHLDIFARDLNFARVRHQIEMDNLLALRHKDKMILISICIALVLLAIAIFTYYCYRLGQNKIILEKHEKRLLQLDNDALHNENQRLELEKRNAELERESQVLASENLRLRIEQLEEESVRLNEILGHHTSLEKPIEDAIKERIGMLNEMLASRISRNGTATVSYEEWIDRIVADKDAFMNSTRLAFKATHPKFMEYLEDHGLTDTEINYVCLYAIGLRVKEVGNYTQSSRYYHHSSAIRDKLGIDSRYKNIGIYIRSLINSF